jgi:hypothetical protein
MFLLYFVVIKTPKTGSLHAHPHHIPKKLHFTLLPSTKEKSCGQTVCPLYLNMAWRAMSEQSIVVCTPLFYNLSYLGTKSTTDECQKYIPTMTNVTTKPCDTLKPEKTAIKIIAASTSILRFLDMSEKS